MGSRIPLDSTGQANGDPQGAGRFFKLALADSSELAALMDEAANRTLLETLD